jgi:hypothetical protein
VTDFDYSDAPFAIREDIKLAHRDYWQRLARPGSWWTGAERVAIAAESRRARTCAFCTERKNALSPYTQAYAHSNVSNLSARAVDAVHRVITDQNRITRTFVADNHAHGLSEEAYVELTGITVAVLSIDEFNRALGLQLEPLPEPLNGKPDEYRPENLTRDTGFVPMLRRDGAIGREQDLWSGERTANVLRALTLVPDVVRDWKMIGSAQYLSIEDMGDFGQQAGRSIDRMQMELVAGRVSSVNECFY